MLPLYKPKYIAVFSYSKLFDKLRFVFIIVPLLTGVVNYLALKREGGASLRSASLALPLFFFLKTP